MSTVSPYDDVRVDLPAVPEGERALAPAMLLRADAGADDAARKHIVCTNAADTPAGTIAPRGDLGNQFLIGVDPGMPINTIVFRAVGQTVSFVFDGDRWFEERQPRHRGVG